MQTTLRIDDTIYRQAKAEAARELGCEPVFSEDLSDGQNYDGVRVENPFRGLSTDILLPRG